MTHSRTQLAADNRRAIQTLLVACPGISRVEIAERLGLHKCVVGRHVIAIRAEWGAKPFPTKRARETAKREEAAR